eukprot:8733786-Alexandrium_andersonii.AAC.1
MIGLQAEAEEASKRHDTRTLYQIVRKLIPRPPISPVAIAKSDGAPTATCAEAAQVWAKHYAETYSGRVVPIGEHFE